MNFENALKALSLSDAVVACAAGRIKSPICTLEAPAQWFGFPPALVPIWSDGSRPTYIGYWKHWFVEREPCFVKMFVSSDRMTTEIARTPSQLFGVIAMMAISLNDEVTLDLEQFAARVGLESLSELDAVSLKTGDDPKGFPKAELFRTLTPLDCNSYDGNPYMGDFPSEFARGNWWETSCSFEVLNKNMRIPESASLPGWFDPVQVRTTLFESFMSAGRLDYAWLTLNSTGWLIADARRAIIELQARTCDEVFGCVAASWLSFADDSAGGY
ncbi:hypothetical protein [Pseudomonas alvandae]|uniref:Uncharacterized protein n=1 Tax=Pseudomonas canavaninivorans TaxID=2842348 RepID=A0ABX8QG92_PSECO|nr:hypothetical protein [Pseudomonas alvandae]QXI54286.1 hypothetical protein KSS97_04875 [Pseudomonas alvandae]